MNSTSDETRKMMEKHVGIHGTAIMACMSVMLDKDGYKVEPILNDNKNIWEAGLRITKDNDEVEGNDEGVKHIEYYLHNTFVEILCVDRDDDPLIFDEKIEEDLKYTINKIGSVLEGRYILITGVLEGKTIEEIYEENSDKYERVRKKIVDADEYNGVTF